VFESRTSAIAAAGTWFDDGALLVFERTYPSIDDLVDNVSLRTVGRFQIAMRA